MNERLKRGQRIRSREEFGRFFKQGRRACGAWLNLWCCEGPELRESGTGPRLGLMVSRATDARAAVRNLWKRRLREAFRKNQSRLKPGTAILIQSRKTDRTPTYLELETEMLELLKKTGNLK